MQACPWPCSIGAAGRGCTRRSAPSRTSSRRTILAQDPRRPAPHASGVARPAGAARQLPRRAGRRLRPTTALRCLPDTGVPPKHMDVRTGTDGPSGSTASDACICRAAVTSCVVARLLRRGIFVPVKDGSAGSATYGGGRYLIDTVKGSDLGGGEGRLILDFNFAYNPSCAYDPAWACPLAPRATRSGGRCWRGNSCPYRAPGRGVGSRARRPGRSRPAGAGLVYWRGGHATGLPPWRR